MLDHVALEVADIMQVATLNLPRGEPETPMAEVGYGTIDKEKPVIMCIGHNVLPSVDIIDHLMENNLFDAGFRWNLTTWIVWGLASEAWFLLGFHSHCESIRVLHITLLIWSGFLLIHFVVFLILRRKTIKGIHKTDIFE